MKAQQIPSEREPCHVPPGSTALVVFEDRAASGVLRLLRPGFRHCFCLLGRDEGWLLCDPLKHSLHLAWLPAVPLPRLLLHFHARGRTALAGSIAASPVPARTRLRPLTCVEVVKRAIGRAELPATTPWRLHESLRRSGSWSSADAFTRLDDAQI